MKLTVEQLFSMDNNEVTGLISIDFKKAFDVVNYDILLQKLKIYGVSDLALQCFFERVFVKRVLNAF